MVVFFIIELRLLALSVKMPYNNRRKEGRKMSLLDALYRLVLGPLELLFDVVYALAYKVSQNPGLSIIALSLIINLLILPLYQRADALQDEERNQMSRMKPGIDKIKRVFKGDEQYLILKTYYRQNNYKPYFALKSSLPLLLQVPFFMAAYNYLSHLQLLQGVSFGLIQNLGLPDMMLQLGGITINVLPVLMTLINIVSGAIYTRGMPLKSKIQLYAMALVFLVLLYDSPAGLVFYWTLNNIFSLVKNVVLKSRNPRLVVRVLCWLAGLAICVFFVLIRPIGDFRRQLIITVVGILAQLPLILSVVNGNKKQKSLLPEKPDSKEAKSGRTIFYISCVLLTVITGILIPSAIINASPGEFIELKHFQSPLIFILNAALLATGFFLLWFGIFYRMSSDQSRKTYSIAAVLLAAVSMVDYYFFGGGYGNLSPTLMYDVQISVSWSEYLINFAVILLVCGIIFLIWKKKKDLLKVICFAACIAIAAMSVMNISGIISKTSEIEKNKSQVSDSTPGFTLDKSGKNVVVIMMDRAIGGFVPYIFNEKPELKEKFAGFTYYPNTLSYGRSTNIGAPALFGGYEYTPFETNKRTELSLREKHNESLKIMPVNFLNAGYEVTVCDPAYANYQSYPDLSIYNDYPSIHAYNTFGAFGADKMADYENKSRTINRNLFCYSVFRCCPLLFHIDVYGSGHYNATDTMAAIQNAGDDSASVEYTLVDSEHSYGKDKGVLYTYDALKNLSYMTSVSNDGSCHFLIFCNETTHNLQLYQEPEYELRNTVDNSAYEKEHNPRVSWDGRHMKLETAEQMAHYQGNMASMLLLANWLDYLRENGLYDNTRIIIVSDHGRSIGLYYAIMDGVENGYYPEDGAKEDIMYYNPLLMVKDFNSSSFVTDNAFMTNADVPTIAFSDLIENPVNPFTGNAINSDMKNNDEQYAMYTDWRIEENNGNTYSDPVRLTLKNHYMFDPANWVVGE